MENWHQRYKRLRETYFENIWDVLTWLSLAGIFLWGIAKALGWINTPFVVETMPLLFAAFAIGRFFQDVKNFHKEQRGFNKEILTRVVKLEKVALK